MGKKCYIEGRNDGACDCTGLGVHGLSYNSTRTVWISFRPEPAHKAANQSLGVPHDSRPQGRLPMLSEYRR